MNPKGLTLWTTDAAEDTSSSSRNFKERRCIWAQHGVWGYDSDTNRPIVLKEGYFTKNAEGKEVSFYKDFYWPFVRRWEDVVKRRSGGKAMLHVEGVPNEVSQTLDSFKTTAKLDLHSVLSRLAGRCQTQRKARLLATLVRPERAVQQELWLHDRQCARPLKSG